MRAPRKTPRRKDAIDVRADIQGMARRARNLCELWLSPSPSCATLVFLLFEVSVTEHPFYVLVGFLLGCVAV